MSLTTGSRRRPGAKALITRGDEVLLTRERRSDRSVYYSLPGGGIEPGESPREAVLRELREELGCTGAVGPPLGTCSYRHRSIDATTEYDVFAVTLNEEPTPDISEGIVGAEFYRPAALPASMLEPLAAFVKQTLGPMAPQGADEMPCETVLID